MPGLIFWACEAVVLALGLSAVWHEWKDAR